MDDISKCPVMHGSATNNKGEYFKQGLVAESIKY